MTTRKFKIISSSVPEYHIGNDQGKIVLIETSEGDGTAEFYTKIKETGKWESEKADMLGYICETSKFKWTFNLRNDPQKKYKTLIDYTVKNKDNGKDGPENGTGVGGNS